jgi:nucleoid-associated protein YejK
MENIKKFNNFFKINENNAEKLALEHDFETAEEYYDYIELSLSNGNRQQVLNLFEELDKNAKKEFMDYSKTMRYDETREYIISNLF